MKKVISIILVTVLLFSAISTTVLAGASEEKMTIKNFKVDNFLAELSFKKNIAEYHTLRSHFYGTTPASYIMVKDGQTVFEPAMESWYAVKSIANPGNSIDNLNFQQQYEAIIYAILFDALCNKEMKNLSYSNVITKASGFMVETSDLCDSIKDFDIKFMTPEDSAKLKTKSLEFVKSGNNKWSALGEYAELVNKISKIIDNVIKTASSLASYTQKISMMTQLMDIGDAGINYLYILKASTDDSFLKSAIQSVIDSLANDWFGIVEEVVCDIGDEVVKEVIDKMIDEAWTTVCKANPFLAGMSIGDAAGTLICNVLLGTEDTLEKYSCMKKFNEIHNAVLGAFMEVEDRCENSLSDFNVDVWMFAIDFTHHEINANYMACVEFAKCVNLNGLCNKFTSLFSDKSKQRYDEFKEEIDWFLNQHNNSYKGFYDCWSYRLEDYYPEVYNTLFVVEGSFSEPPPINKIEFNDDQATYFIKGNIINLNYEINPDDYVGEVGISCNSSIVSIENNVKCWAEDSGEAEITVYSIDDPTIYDTIKIKIVDDINTYQQSIFTYDVNSDGETCTITGLIPGVSPTFMEIPESIAGYTVTSIGTNAFSDCTSLASVVIPNGVTLLGQSAFADCSRIKQLTIPASTRYMKYTFSWCTGIEKVVITPGAGVMLDYTKNQSNTTHMYYSYSPWYESSTKHLEIVIQDGVENIGACAFYNCDNLTKVILGEDVKSIGSYAFYGCTSLKNVTIPANITSIDSKAFTSCTELDKFEVDSDNQYYSNDEYGVLFNKDKTTLIQYPIGNTRTSYTIPDSVIVIDENAFEDCENLTSVTIPNSVTKIEEEAFYFCNNLTSMTIPDSVVTIGDSAFAHCKNITSFSIGKNVKTIGSGAFSRCLKVASISIPNNVSSIGSWAFQNCYNLQSITLPVGIYAINEGTFYGCTSLTSITIPNGVEVIGSSAFFSCTKLTEITIPNSIDSIYGEAFCDCTSLTDVYYLGTKEQWSKMLIIGAYNTCLTDATIHYYNTDEHSHSYTFVVTPPTCIFEGYTTYTCECGDSYISNYTNAAGHTYINGICKACGVSDPDYLPAEPEHNYTFSIQSPSRTEIRHKDGIMLHAKVEGTAPAGSYVEWTASNGKFKTEEINNGNSLKIVSDSNGKTTFTATLYSADGEILAIDTIEMKSKAGFFDKLGSFFRSLFGGTKIYDNEI